MNVLVIGGTRFIGKHLVSHLLLQNHNVAIATRGRAPDNFDNRVERIIFDRLDKNSIRQALSTSSYDVIYDSLAYCSNDIKNLLDNIVCKKYITISTTAVYHKHIDTKETEFDPSAKKLVWCNRADFPYDEVKRQAECALVQNFLDTNPIMVRFPFVIGEDDYTNRLLFYIEHIVKQKPMFVNNYTNQMAFVRSDEAGKFLAFLADKPFVGAVNGASAGTISIEEIAEYVKTKTGKTAILHIDGEKAPYNDEHEYSINTDIANRLGFAFSPLDNWIFSLIDFYIEQLKN